jgi:hypothetical protein
MSTVNMVTVLAAGEKRGNVLLVQGEEFRAHESDIANKAKAHLSKYGRLCHKEPAIVTVNGDPLFQLAALDEKDDRLVQLGSCGAVKND